MKRLVNSLLLMMAFQCGCVSYSLSNDGPSSRVLSPSDASPLSHNAPGGTNDSGFLPLIEGSDAFDVRMALASSAVTSLDIQYYIWHRDKTGVALLSSLLDAAERGVRVRLLLDDMNLGEDREFLEDLDRHPKIEIRLFNPSASDSKGLSMISRSLQMVFDFSEMNRRMHNKVFIADSSMAIVGGRNIGDEYFDLKKDKSFRDLDVLAAGAVTKKLGTTFDAYWNAPEAFSFKNKAEVKGDEWKKIRAAHSIEKQSRAEDPFEGAGDTELIHATLGSLKEKLIWGHAEAMADSPHLEDEKAPGLEDKIMKWPLPKKTFLVESAYFVPPPNLLKLFEKLEASGVTIKVLTNSLQSNDVMLAHAGYMSKRREVLETGAELYEWRMKKVRVKTQKGGGLYASRAGLHSKTFVIDDEYIFIGSMNLDGRSIDINTESGLMIQSRDLAKQITQFIEDGMGDELSWSVALVCPKESCSADEKHVEWKGMKDGRFVTLEQEPEAGFWKRTTARFMSHLPIEDKL